jgi:hypothetical protein
MAGNILLGPAASSSALTVTNLHSLASSQDWLTGWSSASFNNTSNKYVDMLIGVTFTTHASNRQAGFINIYVVPALNDTPTWPATATGTIGTEGALSFTDTEERDSLCELIAQIAVDNTASAIYAKLCAGIASRFGGSLPPYYAIYISHNCSTTTTAGLAAAGSAVYASPVIGSYT